MMMQDIQALAHRRNRFMFAGKSLLLGGVVLWLIAILFYDPIHAPRLPAILLPTRASKWLVLGRMWPYNLRPIWGGPMHLLGLRIATGTISTIGLITIAWVRIGAGRWSCPGVAIFAAAFVLAGFIGPAGRFAVYPMVVSTRDFDALAASIDTREPGLIARLEDGWRPDLPDTGGEHLPLPISGPGVHAEFTDERVLVDRDDAESLRFALAQRAWLKGDVPTLKRLLPVTLSLPPTDLPARNDIGHRLAAMGRAASISPVPEGYSLPVAQWDADWVFWTKLAWWLTQLMHVVMLSGLVSIAIGLVLRRRSAKVEAHAAALGNTAPSAPVVVFGRKRRLVE